MLVENYRPGVLAKMGFDQAAARSAQSWPGGLQHQWLWQRRPLCRPPAFDFIAQAMSGFMSVNGEAKGEPMRAGPPMSDLIAGLYAAFGVVAALVARGGQGSGKGQRVEASLTNGLISMLAYFSAQYFADRRATRAHRQRPPRGLSLWSVSRRRWRGRDRAEYRGVRPPAHGYPRSRPSARRSRLSPPTMPECSTASASKCCSTPRSASTPSPNGSSGSIGSGCRAVGFRIWPRCSPIRKSWRRTWCSTSSSRATARCGSPVSRSSSAPHPAKSATPHHGSASRPMPSWPSSATPPNESRPCARTASFSVKPLRDDLPEIAAAAPSSDCQKSGLAPPPPRSGPDGGTRSGSRLLAQNRSRG